MSAHQRGPARLTVCLLLCVSLGVGGLLASAAPSPAAAQQGPGAAEKPETEVYELTFLDSVLTPLDGGSAAATPGTRVNDTIAALNAVFGTDEQKPPIRRARQFVFITGTLEMRQSVKNVLFSVDSPLPQVQMDLYPIQISGSRHEVADYASLVGREFRVTQQRLRSVQTLLTQLVAGSTGSLQDNDSGKTGEMPGDPRRIARMLHVLGFEREPRRPLSLTEAFVFLALATAEERKSVLEAVGASVESSRKEEALRTRRRAAPAANDAPLRLFPAHYGLDVEGGRLVPLKAIDPVGATQRGIHDFCLAMMGFRWESFPIALRSEFQQQAELRYPPSDPASKRRALADVQTTSAALDRQLKSAMDAYAADMHRLFMQPLLNRLQAGIPSRSSGISLAGSTRMVVSSSVESRLDATMASYTDATRPRPFGPDILDQAFPTPLRLPAPAPGATPPPPAPGPPPTTKNSGSAAVMELLAASNPAAAALLAAAFADAVQASYLKVAPGLSVRLRPRVLPDNGSARIQIAMRVGVATSITDADQDRSKEIFRGPLPDAVEKHEVHTDAIVSAFDLFDISSLSFATSTPQAPSYVPILGRLPIIGPAFQFPRENRRVHHESIILVNAVILPRSVDLASRHFGK